MSSPLPEPDFPPRPLVEAWRADTASTAELRRGYARFMRRRPQRRAARRVTAFVLGGLVLGLGLAQAASIVRERWLERRAVAVAPWSAPPAAFQAGASASPKPQPAPEAEPTPTPETAPREQRTLRAAPAPAPATQPQVQEQWQRAAAALREQDFTRAHSALLEIERSASSAEADAARLARAQLLASHGQPAQALTLAGALVDQAESALVRDKARALVARLTKKENTDRSAQPGAAVKQP